MNHDQKEMIAEGARKKHGLNPKMKGDMLQKALKSKMGVRQATKADRKKDPYLSADSRVYKKS